MEVTEFNLESLFDEHLNSETGSGFIVSPFTIPTKNIIESFKECKSRYQYFLNEPCGSFIFPNNRKSLNSINGIDKLQINNQKGRNHCEYNLDLTVINSKPIQTVLNLVKPLVQRYFLSHSKIPERIIDNKKPIKNNEDHIVLRDSPEMFKIVLTNLQIVDALPGCEDAIWFSKICS